MSKVEEARKHLALIERMGSEDMTSKFLAEVLAERDALKEALLSIRDFKIEIQNTAGDTVSAEDFLRAIAAQALLPPNGEQTE